MRVFYMMIFLFAILVIANNSKAQDTEAMKPVVVEAEQGIVGSKYAILNDGVITYVTTTENYTGQEFPGDTSRMITYQVTLKEAGLYDLFGRMRVGAGNYNDDSFFASRGFGEKDANTGSDWVMMNGLAAAGHSNPKDIVDEMGAAGSQVWKWVNLTRNFYQNIDPAQLFSADEDNMTLTFMIGSREDGLDFDKFAFGKADLYYTVEMLDSLLPGSVEWPGDSSKFYLGPPFAEGSPKFLGNLKAATDNNFAKMWNQLTPENEGKWASVGNTTDSTRWNWTGLDNLYKYTRDNNMPFKNHTLVWGAQQPSWINDLTPDKQLEYIETYIRMTAERYPETEMIDVVNEALPTHNPPDGRNNRANYKDALGGDGVTGWDWVIKSFELARKYMPNTVLILNDYGIINDNNATTSYLKIINLLIERDLIDGIGVQGHRFELESVAVSTIKYNLDRLGATGLPIYISEFDLGNVSNAGTPNDDVQLQLYKKVFPVIWEHPSVVGVTLWGYIQNRMWQETCHLVLTDGSWRPALTWLADYVKNTPVEINLPVVSATSVEMALEQNYPNPFNAYTNIKFSLKNGENVSIKVFDALGREVATVADGVYKAGNHTIVWDAINNQGSKITNGIYICRLVAGNKTVNRKMIFMD